MKILEHITCAVSSVTTQYLTSVVLWGHGLGDDLSEGLQPLLLLLMLLTHKHILPVRSLQHDATIPPAAPRTPPAALWSRVAVALRADEDSTQLCCILTGKRKKKSIIGYHLQNYAIYNRLLNKSIDMYKLHVYLIKYFVWRNFIQTLWHMWYYLLITRGFLEYRSFLFMEHSVNHLFLNGSRC